MLAPRGRQREPSARSSLAIAVQRLPQHDGAAMTRNTFAFLLPLVLLAGLIFAADRGKPSGPRPNDPIPKTKVMKLTGDWEGKRLSRDVRILWLTGPEDHGGGEHDYIRNFRVARHQPLMARRIFT